MNPHYTVPSHYQPVYTQEQINARIRELGHDVGTWCKSIFDATATQVLAVCIMRGGMFFYADLVRALPCSVELGFCQVTSYSRAVAAQALTGDAVVVDTLKPKDRTLLLIDEICDSGKTMRKLQEICLKDGAREVKTAVFIHRTRPDSAFKPDFIGFNYPEKYWLVGYGMDDGDKNSNIPGVYYIPGTSAY